MDRGFRVLAPRLLSAVGLAALALAACQGPPRSGLAPGTAPELGSGAETFVGGSRAVTALSPVQAYAIVARMVHACWLNPRRPLLTKHDFSATARPGGTATILIAEETPSGNLRAFTVDFDLRPGGTVIRPENVRVPDPLGGMLLGDIKRWSAGDLTCGAAAAAAAKVA